MVTKPCPICEAHFGGECHELPSTRDVRRFECAACGEFQIVDLLLSGQLENQPTKLTWLQRAALAHRLQTANRESKVPMVDCEWFNRFLCAPTLPTPAIQAANIIRFVGEEVLRTGAPMERLRPNFASAVGSPRGEFARQLAKELVKKEILQGIEVRNGKRTYFGDLNLTLKGWEAYEAEKQGKIRGDYGFVALRFENKELDSFLRTVISPALRSSIGLELKDMRDFAKAGVIDNIMRAQIRDAAFVLADLTDDNAGAYWEAGYAEGLGKPVIYMCEATKFKRAQTHFDTNHCTTIKWTLKAPDDFTAELIATLRQSLNRFPSM
jgi:hypothetical protein